MDINKMIREITEEVLKNIRTEDVASSPASRSSAFDAPVGRSVGGGSVYDLGPCAADMRRETAMRRSEPGKGSAFDGNFSSGANKADFDFSNRNSVRTRGSVFDYQTHL